MCYSGGYVDNGGGYACVGAAGIWERYVVYILASQFCSELKISLKSKIFHKKLMDKLYFIKILKM